MASNIVPVPVTFEYEGKEYTLSPAVFSTFAAFEAKVQRDLMDDAKRDCEGMSDIVARAIMLDARDKKSRLQLGTSEFSMAMLSTRYLPEVLKLLLSKNHRDLPVSVCHQMLDSDKGDEITAKVLEAIGAKDGNTEKK